MKSLKLMILVLVLLGLIPGTAAWARGGGGHGGGGFGGGGHMGGGGWGHGGGGHPGGMHYGGAAFRWRSRLLSGRRCRFISRRRVWFLPRPKRFLPWLRLWPWIRLWGIWARIGARLCLGYGFGGYGGGYGYGPPYYPYSPVVAVPAAPQVYIQRQDMSPQDDRQRSVQLPANYWYYCRAPAGYYPYVNNCPNGWEQVAPQPSIQ